MASHPTIDVKSILILQTGGTIDKIYPQNPGAYGFEIGPSAVEKILDVSSGNIEFPYRIETVCTKASQEITDADREDILRFVVDSDHSAILITHGTDTMCETAQYLIKAGVGQGQDYGPGVGLKTVFLTGAFKPECMRDTDAHFNVGFALGCLQTCRVPGVFIAMGGRMIQGLYAARNAEGKFVDRREYEGF